MSTTMLGRDEETRTLPCSFGAEQAVLGGVMLSGEAAFHRVETLLEERDFHHRSHRLIWRALVQLVGEDSPIDPVTAADWFLAQGLAEEIEGGAYLVELASTTPSAANVVAHAEIVRDKSLLRALIEAGTSIANDGYAPAGRDTSEVLALAARRINALAGDAMAAGPRGMREIGRTWFDQLQRRLEANGALLGLPTPWAGLNDMTGGLKAGELVVVAGRPGMGKSAFAVNLATHNALAGKRVLFLNLEMTAESIYQRAVASLAGVPLRWLRSPGDEDDSCWNRVGEAVAALNGASLGIDDTPSLSGEQIVARIRRENQRKPLDLVVIDHLHLIPLPGKTRETVEIGHVTRDLKALAKTIGAPIVLLSQLNRSVDGRAGNKRPLMADLRESGSIEQDADLIVFLYRDDYYAAREERTSDFPGFVELIVAKQREGEIGKVWATDRLGVGKIEAYEGAPPQSVQGVTTPPRPTTNWVRRTSGKEAAYATD